MVRGSPDPTAQNSQRLHPGYSSKWAPLLIATMLGFSAFLIAIPSHAQLDTELDISNVAPVVEDVTLPSSTISPSAGSTTSVTSTILVTDTNGCSDIDTVQVTVWKPDETVHIAESAATYEGCTLGVTATYTYQFDMNFHDAPALETDQYKIKVVATDQQGATGDNLLDLALFNFEELVALNVSSGALDYGGPLNPGDESSIVALPVQNHGNVQIDTELSGTDMTHATEDASIAVAASAYSPNDDMTASSPLATTPATFGLGLAAGADASSPVYWRMTVPSGEDQWVPSGHYTGSLTVSAVKAT